MDSTAKPAADVQGFRAILHTGDDSEPIGDLVLPFVPFLGLKIADPRTNCYAPVRSICWDGDDAAFLLEIDE